MAVSILSDSFLKLNQNQAEILFEIMLTGSKMAKGIQHLDPNLLPNELLLLSKLMPRLVSKLGDSLF